MISIDCEMRDLSFAPQTQLENIPHFIFAKMPNWELIAARDMVATVSIICLNDSVITQGSGFFVSSRGDVVTSAHVIQGAFKIQVCVGGNFFIATVSGVDAKNDIGLLKIEGFNSSYLKLGDSSQLCTGQPLAVLGAPAVLTGRANVLSTGILCGRGEMKSDRFGPGERLWHTCITSGGSSGGPILNALGEVVGMVQGSINQWNIGVPSIQLREALESFHIPVIP